ncbi:unnamed protein product [Pedinophyceae sp. YPF-701]|nr:unnamed protein product [Pedinophyceae sp. YPF-701]
MEQGHPDVLGPQGAGAADAWAGEGGASGSSELQRELKDYLLQPENRPVLEAIQRKEHLQAVKDEERRLGLLLKDRILRSSPEVRQALGPLVGIPVLRRIMLTFMSDPSGDFERWAANPYVQRVLRGAAEAIGRGVVSEADIEQSMLASLKDPRGAGHQEFAANAHRKVGHTRPQ